VYTVYTSHTFLIFFNVKLGDIQPRLLILIMKANEMNCFSYLFDKALYMFRTGQLSIIRSISTLYTRNRCLSC